MDPKNENSQKDTQSAVIESDSPRTTASEAIAEIYSLGNELIELGEFVKQALDAHHDNFAYEELSQKATRIRSFSTDAGRLALDMMRHAGGLEALAEVSRAAGHRSGEDV